MPGCPGLPAWPCGRVLDGGAKEDRTPDLLRARQALSQLSYGPRSVPSPRPVRAVSQGRRAAGMAGAGRPLQKWWAWEDLNLRPHPYQGCALTN